MTQPRGNDENNGSMWGGGAQGDARPLTQHCSSGGPTKPMKCVHSDTLLTSGETEAQSLRNLPKVTQRKRDGARIPSQLISPCQPCPRGLRQHTLITLRVWYKMLVSRLCPFPEVLGENRFLLTQAVGRTQVLLWD